VVGDFKTVTLGDGMLPTLDVLIDEFLDMSTINALDVVVVGPLVELEDRHAISEVMAGDEPSRFELG
jgi:hypothetical protein